MRQEPADERQLAEPERQNNRVVCPDCGQPVGATKGGHLTPAHVPGETTHGWACDDCGLTLPAQCCGLDAPQYTDAMRGRAAAQFRDGSTRIIPVPKSQLEAAAATDGGQCPPVTERPLGPFSTLLCWVKGHEWCDSPLKGLSECARCWKLGRTARIETDEEPCFATDGGRPMVYRSSGNRSSMRVSVVEILSSSPSSARLIPSNPVSVSRWMSTTAPANVPAVASSATVIPSIKSKLAIRDAVSARIQRVWRGFEKKTGRLGPGPALLMAVGIALLLACVWARGGFMAALYAFGAVEAGFIAGHMVAGGEADAA